LLVCFLKTYPHYEAISVLGIIPDRNHITGTQ
jgi:hypothetical protein